MVFKLILRHYDVIDMSHYWLLSCCAMALFCARLSSRYGYLRRVSKSLKRY